MSVLLDNWLSQRAQTCPERTAVSDGARSLDYAELEARAQASARRLAAQGVRRGSVVALALEPTLEHVTIAHALMKLGAVAFPIAPTLTAAERASLVEPHDPVLTIEDPGELDGPEADMPLLGEHDLDAICCRILTSGTSGERRAVGLTYGNHLFSAVGSAFNLGVDPADEWLCCLPLCHVSGLSIVLRSVIYGTACIVHRSFDPERIDRALDAGASLVSLVPTQLARLIEAGVDVSRPRVILVGGGPVPTAVLEEAMQRRATVVQTYGLTEAASQVTTLAAADARRKLGSAGRPLLTTHLRVHDGEILVQGPTVAPEALDPDGWLSTGDLGRIDGEGFLHVTGRLADIIVSGGEKVMPAEVEGALTGHPAVADAAVVGRPDPEWQEAVTALVIPRAGARLTARSLRDHLRESLAPHKIPKRFELVDSLPRTASGKLVRGSLGQGAPLEDVE